MGYCDCGYALKLLREVILRRVIAIAVIAGVVIAACNPFRPGEPAWSVQLKRHVESAASAGEIATLLSQALYDGDKKAAAQIATSLNDIALRGLETDPPAHECLTDILSVEAEYYGALKRASTITTRSIMTLDWEPLILAGENLLLAEELSMTYAQLVAGLDPAACS